MGMITEMRFLLVASTVGVLACLTAAVPLDPDTIHPLLPTPFQFTNGLSSLIVNSQTFVFSSSSSSAVITAAATRYRNIMFGWEDAVEPQTGGQQMDGCEVQVLDQADDAFQLGDDESYSLTVSSEGECQLRSASVWGALRGFESLSQLVEYNASSLTYQIRQVPWNISDKPAFPHRGVMIDSARHWLSVPTILRQIDALAYNKMNTLHWHAVDADSFPIQSDTFPKLATTGSYSSSIVGSKSTRPTVGIYSVADQLQIVEYARMRGVRVLIEFDLPGHSSSWAQSLPELFVKCSAGPHGDFGGVSWMIDPTLEASYKFLDQFITEFGSRFPDRVLHFGGDEVNIGCFNNSASVRAWMRQHNTTSFNDVYIHFERRLHELAGKHGKTLQTWADVFRQVNNASKQGHGSPLPRGAIAQEWANWDGNGEDESGADEVKEVVRAGGRAVRSSGLYFSTGYSTGGNAVIWESIINAQIVPQGLTVGEAARVIGAESCMWGEVTDQFFIDQKLWLRTSVLAERLWTPNEQSMRIATICLAHMTIETSRQG